MSSFGTGGSDSGESIVPNLDVFEDAHSCWPPRNISYSIKGS